jgi:hypothetical protein
MGSTELHPTISKANEYVNPFADNELLIFDEGIRRRHCMDTGTTSE